MEIITTQEKEIKAGTMAKEIMLNKIMETIIWSIEIVTKKSNRKRKIIL